MRTFDASTKAGDPITLNFLNRAAVLMGQQISLAVVESPITGSSMNFQTSAKMAMAAGAIITGLGAHTRRIELVPPSTWKKEVTGRGNSNKQQVTEWLRSAHPVLADLAIETGGKKRAQDLTDAACLALCAQARLAG